MCMKKDQQSASMGGSMHLNLGRKSPWGYLPKHKESQQRPKGYKAVGVQVKGKDWAGEPLLPVVPST